MKKIASIVLVVALGLFSCGSPKMDSALVKSMTIGHENGIVAGVNVGDSWDDVKKNVHEAWEIDESTHYLSKEWDSFNNVLLSIDLDEDNTVWAISYTINGKKGNHLLMAEIQNALEKEFNAKYKVSESGGWDIVAPNGDQCGLSMNLHKQEDSGNNMLTVTVFNLS
jgi:hypothetical protein